MTRINRKSTNCHELVLLKKQEKEKKQQHEQISALSDFSNILKKIYDVKNRYFVFGGNFNLFFEAKSEA